MSKDIEEIARASLVERLRAWPGLPKVDALSSSVVSEMMNEAADALAAYSVMEKRLGEMRAALVDVQQYPLPTRTERLIADALNNESKPVENG